MEQKFEGVALHTEEIVARLFLISVTSKLDMTSIIS